MGLVVADRYRLSAVIGQGGMGRVFEAEHIHTGWPAARQQTMTQLGEEIVQAMELAEPFFNSNSSSVGIKSLSESGKNTYINGRDGKSVDSTSSESGVSAGAQSSLRNYAITNRMPSAGGPRKSKLQTQSRAQVSRFSSPADDPKDALMAKTQRFALVSAIIIIVAAGTMALSYVLISAAKKAPSIRSPIAAAPTVQKRRAAAIKCAQ